MYQENNITVIYKITSPSGKIYIGQSRNFKKRLCRYGRKECKSQKKLYNSLLKYTPEHHKFEICHYLPSDIANNILDNYEILYWEFYKDLGFEMLNLKDPGKQGRLSRESIEQGAMKRRGRIKSEDERARISKGNRGKVRSQLFKDNVSKFMKGNSYCNGFKQSNETIEKRRKLLIGKIPSEEKKIKISNSLKGKEFSEERKKRISDALKLYHKNKKND